MHHSEPVAAANAVANAPVNRVAIPAARSDEHAVGSGGKAASSLRGPLTALAGLFGLTPRRRTRRDLEPLRDDPYAAYLRWKRGCADDLGLAPEVP
jgi:hypothetical protein